MMTTGTGRRAAGRIIAMLSVLASVLATASCNATEPEADAPARADADIVVYKTPYCGCCSKWVEQLEQDGLAVETVNVDNTLAIGDELGVPRQLRSCHTARVGKLWVEGHVPVDLVRKLVLEQPGDIQGLAVPGMPIGSPGMEGPNPERYAVMQVDADGEIDVHAERQGVSRPTAAEGNQ